MPLSEQESSPKRRIGRLRHPATQFLFARVAMCACLCTPVLRTGAAAASARLQWNELALAEFVSRPGNAVGDVLGFTISGVLQVFVSKERMTRAFGHTSFKSVALATGFGAASSSCSYAAVAAARSAIQ